MSWLKFRLAINLLADQFYFQTLLRFIPSIAPFVNEIDFKLYLVHASSSPEEINFNPRLYCMQNFIDH